MKAVAVFPTQRAVRLIDHPPPELIAPTQVKVRMLEVGICGTDREIAGFDYGTPPPGAEYLVLGHESLGQVMEIGSGVTRVKPGDLIVFMVRRPCSRRDCPACAAGRQDFCYTGEFTERGIKEAHGFMTELVVDDERYVVPVPPALREVAVLTEPLTIAEKALAQIWDVQNRLPWACPIDPERPGPGQCHRAVVLGAGPVGLLGAMALVVAGFETTVYSRASGPHRKAELVAEFGGTYLSAETHTIEQVAESVGNIDLVFEATGAAQISFEMMRVLGTNGVFVFTGVPGRKGPIALEADLIMRDLVLRNQVVFGTVNAAHASYEAALRDLATFVQKWPEAVRRLITQRSPIAEARSLLLDPATGIKNVIRLD